MKVQTYVETCQPGESPRFGFAKPPPFGKGGFGLCTYCTAVTIPGGSGKERIVEDYRAYCHRGHPGQRALPAAPGLWELAKIFDF